MQNCKSCIFKANSPWISRICLFCRRGAYLMNFSICTNRLTADDKAFYRNFRTVFWERFLKSGTKMLYSWAKTCENTTVLHDFIFDNSDLTENYWTFLDAFYLNFRTFFKKISPGTWLTLSAWQRGLRIICVDFVNKCIQKQAAKIAYGSIL